MLDIRRKLKKYSGFGSNLIFKVSETLICSEHEHQRLWAIQWSKVPQNISTKVTPTRVKWVCWNMNWQSPNWFEFWEIAALKKFLGKSMRHMLVSAPQGYNVLASISLLPSALTAWPIRCLHWILHSVAWVGPQRVFGQVAPSHCLCQG